MELGTDVLELVVSKMSNSSIRTLLLIPYIWYQVRTFASKSHFWYLRIQVLVERELDWQALTCREGRGEEFSATIWKEAYYILLRMRKRKVYKFNNREDNPLIARILLLLSINPSSGRNGAIIRASSAGRLNTVKILLSLKNVDPSARHNRSIEQASKHNHATIVQLLLLNEKVKSHSGCQIAMTTACIYGSIDVVALLLEEGDIEGDGILELGLILASSNGRDQVISLLLRDGRANPAVNDNLALKIAMICKHTEVMTLLANDSRVDTSEIDTESLDYMTPHVLRQVLDAMRG